MQKLQHAYDHSRTGLDAPILETIRDVRPRVFAGIVQALDDGLDITLALKFFCDTLTDPQLLSVCGGAEAAADTDLLKAMVNTTSKFNLATESFEQTIKKGNKSGGDDLFKLVELVDEVAKLSKSTAAVHNQAFKPSVELLRLNGSQHIEQLKGKLQAGSETTLREAGASLSKMCNTTADVAGGGLKTKSWHVLAPADLPKSPEKFRDWIKVAITKVEAAEVESKMQTLLTALLRDTYIVFTF
jgi:hypothetical protein